MTYSGLKTLLDTEYGTNWAVGRFDPGTDVADGSVTLNFVSDTPAIGDNTIYLQRPSYQLSYFCISPESDIDDFFIDNSIPYTLKTKNYISGEECWQTTYTFYL